MISTDDDEIEFLIKAIVHSYCDDEEFLKEVKRTKAIDFGKAFQNHIKRGNINHKDYLEVKKRVLKKRTYE